MAEFLSGNKPLQDMVWFKVDPLKDQYHGKKIKRVMVQYASGKVYVFIKGKEKMVEINRKQAIKEGILTPPPQVKISNVDSPLYLRIVNTITMESLDQREDSLLAPDGYVKRNDNKNEFQCEVYVADSTQLIVINKWTKDTTQLFNYKIQRLPSNEVAEPVVQYGNIKGVKATPAFFKEQKEISITKGFEFISATLYFVGKGFDNVYVRTLQGPLLSQLGKIISDSCIEGSQVVIDNVLVRTAYGRLMHCTGRVVELANNFTEDEKPEAPKLVVGELYNTRASANLFKKQKDIRVTQGYTFVRAEVRFAGAGFRSGYNEKLEGPLLAPLQTVMNKCVPGTIVYFDNVIIKDADNNTKSGESLGVALY